MSAPAFTPGPWSVSDYPYECNEHRMVIRAADHACIASVGNMGATSDHPPAAKRWKAETPANAHLIAASPTMFEYIRKRADAGDDEARQIVESICARS